MRLAGYSCHVLRLEDRSEAATGETHLRRAPDRRAAARDSEPETSRGCSPQRLMTRPSSVRRLLPGVEHLAEVKAVQERVFPK